MKKPRILAFDIETCPIEAYVWQLKQDYIPSEHIKADRAVIAYAAKWVGSSKIYYQDQRAAKYPRNDKQLLKGLAALIDQADILLTKNGKRFDVKVMNGRLAANGLRPTAPVRHIDTEQLVRKHMALPSYSLAYLSRIFGLKVKKSKHKAYPGFELWRACLAGDKRAWKEMEHYNKTDVLATEELYKKVRPWGTGVDLGMFGRVIGRPPACKDCGGTRFQYRGTYSKAGFKSRRYQCVDCGSWDHLKGKENNLLKRSA